MSMELSLSQLHLGSPFMGVSEMPWSLIRSWDYVAPVAEVIFTDLGSYQELLCLMSDISASLSGIRQLQVGIDNGSSWISSANAYISVSDAGTAAAATAWDIHSGASGSARGGIVWIIGFNQPFNNKPIISLNRSTPAAGRIGTASACNAIRFFNSAGGNFTSQGFINVWAR